MASSGTAVPEEDRLRLRRTLGRFGTGVTLVTLWHEERPYGFTANSFTSISLDPPLVLISISKLSANCDRIRAAKAFAVNILSDEQQHLAVQFAGAHRFMPEPFGNVVHRRGSTGSPILAESLGWFDCTLYATYEGGDHLIFLGEVRDFDADPSGKPLLFYGGNYIKV